MVAVAPTSDGGRGLPRRARPANHRLVEMAPVALLTLLVAIAGPVGVSLGWWLGRRGERERQGREERRSAYVAFVHAPRSGTGTRTARDARDLRDERWAAIAEIVLVAPPPVVQAAAIQVSTGDRLLAAELGPEQRLATFQEMWQNNIEFTRLARTDLGIDAANPFEGLSPVVGERITFERPLRTGSVGRPSLAW